MSRRAAFDWIDALLFAFGFAASIALAVVLENALQIRLARGALVLAFAPIVVRRLALGAPPPREVRSGPLWSLLSIAGLLTIFAGTAALAMSGAAAFDRGAPDFEAEARASYVRADAEIGALGAVSFGLADPRETAAARAEREAREASERAARREADIQRAAAEARAEWEEHRAQRTATAWKLAAAGLALATLGALLVRARQIRA